MDDLRLSVSTEEAVATVRVEGEVDAATASHLDECLRCAESNSAALEIDLAGVTFMDSAGLSVLVAAHRRTRAAGTRLVLVGATPSVRRLFNIVGLDTVLEIR